MTRTPLLAFAFFAFLTGCAHRLPDYENPIPRAQFQKLRTTAYTDSESGHRRYGKSNALDTQLQSAEMHSAAADWARWPAGTVFRIQATQELYIVDDYGWALAGTNTIDLYKPTPAAMREWGVRRVTIEILQWGDPHASHKILYPRRKYAHVRRMLHEIEKFY
ncbi:MAG: 3D domain-containing protein [Chthoniobacterales bacterium]